MQIVSRLLLAALAAAALTACPSEPPPPPPEPAKPVEPPPPPPKPTLPEYAPTGDFADIKKAAAAGIDDTTAAAKATELEANLDKAIADLEAAAAAAPKKK